MIDIYKFAQDVDRVAQIMCEEMGVDPWHMVPDNAYQAPIAPHVRGSRLPHEDPQSYTPCTMPRYMLYRREAALALAGWRAVHKFAIVDK